MAYETNVRLKHETVLHSNERDRLVSLCSNLEEENLGMFRGMRVCSDLEGVLLMLFFCVFLLDLIQRASCSQNKLKCAY